MKMLVFLLRRSRVSIAAAIVRLRAPEECNVAWHLCTFRSSGAWNRLRDVVYKHSAPTEQNLCLIKSTRPSHIYFTASAVCGSFKSDLFIRLQPVLLDPVGLYGRETTTFCWGRDGCRKDLNEPHTAVHGIRGEFSEVLVL